MNMLSSPLSRFVVVCFAGISLASFVIPQPSFAGPSGSNPLQNLNPQDDNPLAPRSSEVNSFGGIFDLYHRAQLGTSPWNGEQSNQELNDAAASFRAKQQQMLQQGQKPKNPGFQVGTPR